MHSLVGIDLDGTLIDSAPDLAHALGRALDAVGLPRPTVEQTRAWVGDGIEALLVRALSHATGTSPDAGTLKAALETFDACYAGEYFVRSSVYPGVPGTLRRLREGGVHTVCITNKRRSFADPLLQAAGIRPLLDLVYGGDSFAHKKPAPDQLQAAAAHFGVSADRAVMIGDSPNDLDAARAAGWHFVFAVYGYTSAMRERGLSPEPTIASFAEILEILK